MVFDHVQVPRGKSWHNRNRILVDDAARWLTLPIQRKGQSAQRYYEVRITPGLNVRKQLRMIELAYQSTDCFDEVFPVIERVYFANHELLLDFNLDFIKCVVDLLGLTPNFVLSHDLVRSAKT